MLIFHLDRLNSVCHLYISPTTVSELFIIAHSKEHLGFSRYHEIISQSWFIWALTKLLRSFTCYCPQYLALQTRKYAVYSSLQPIQSLPIPFFTLALDFILAPPLGEKDYNALMSVTCNFSKRVTLIQRKNILTTKDWAHVFLTRLDLVNWDLSREVITDRDPKFLNKF